MVTVQTYYADEKSGGYFLSADYANELIIRSKTIAYNTVPSGNGVMAEYLARLYLLTGNEVAPPWRVILRIPPGATLARNHPAYGKTNVDKPAAFVCMAGTCSLPIDSAKSLRERLTKL
jgi:uncharacterized protein YyaL (SSP411 family)